MTDDGRARTVFETERLVATGWELDDAEAAFAMYGDPEVTRYVGGQPQVSVETTRALLDSIRARDAAQPGFGSFPLRSKATGELVGTALIKRLPDADGEPTRDVEIGWHLARRHWGNGYATEAGRALLAHGFVELDLQELHVVVEEPNVASQAVVGRLGVPFVGETSAYYGRELLHYVLLRSDWKPERSA